MVFVLVIYVRYIKFQVILSQHQHKSTKYHWFARYDFSKFWTQYWKSRTVTAEIEEAEYVRDEEATTSTFDTTTSTVGMVLSVQNQWKHSVEWCGGLNAENFSWEQLLHSRFTCFSDKTFEDNGL